MNKAVQRGHAGLDMDFRMFDPPAFEPSADDAVLGRVVKLDRSLPLVCTERGTFRAEHSANFAKGDGKGGGVLPCLGDWVELKSPSGQVSAIITSVLPRRDCFKRFDPHSKNGVQVLASNIDRVAILHALGKDPLDMRRLERELVVALGCTEDVATVLTKSDQAECIERDVACAKEVSPRTDVYTCSSVNASGLDGVRAFVAPGKVVAFFGASGVGKSTLINALVGFERQATGAVREYDGKGRHTTVAREMVPLPGGGVVIDMPGVRNVTLADDIPALDAAFPEISALAGGCRFRDCAHKGEPGCAVGAAVAVGEVSEARLASYLTLRAEMRRNRAVIPQSQTAKKAF